MAILQVDFYSRALSKITNFYMVIPNDGPPQMATGNECYQRNTKVLYLLHGFSGAGKDWMLGSPVQEMAAKYNMAIVMPSGDNSFYLDAKGTGRAYCRFVGQELVDYVRMTFGLSYKREDTYIGGFSMGGFGAIHTALAYPDTFGKLMALSSALITRKMINKKEEDIKDGIADYDYYVSTFGDLSMLEHSVNHPEFLIHKLKEEKREVPGIYMACGTEDFLIEDNREFHRFLQEEDVPVTYVEGPGIHNWAFWNQYLEPSIQWMLSGKQ